MRRIPTPTSVGAIAVLSLALVAAGCTSGTAPSGPPAAAGASADTGAGNPPSTASGSSSGGSAGLGDPVDLQVDPCTLVTQDEAAAALGASVKQSTIDDGGEIDCRYDAVGSFAYVVVKRPILGFCKLLYEALNRNLFGGAQQRVDGIGDGGMIVTGEGDVQIAVHHGCITVDASTADAPLPDTAMLDLARAAVGRVP